jgi:protein phosphatase
VPTVIPLHSLVFSTTGDLCHFPPHEIVEVSAISAQLIGIGYRQDFPQVVFGEVRHRVALKLSLGERVVLRADEFSSDQRRQLVIIAERQGATVVEAVSGSVCYVQSFPLTPRIADFTSRDWQGITVIGDVHGEIEPLEQALAWAKSRHHLAWFLGDVVDYGAQTLAAMVRVYDAVMAGEAVMMLANHERKIARLLNNENNNLRMSEGNRVTIDAYDALGVRERMQWAGRFRALLAHSATVRTVGDLTLMHAAAHPSLWTQPDPQAIEQFALYGEAEHSSGHYRRSHRWVDQVPEGQTVIVGHNILFQFPMVVRAARGGRVIFLDTGCGKGGHLSSADFRIQNGMLRLECFKRY